MAVAQQNTREGTLELASASFAAIKGPNGDDDDGLDGLGDLISGHAAQRHDDRREIEVVGEHCFNELFKKYKLYLECKDYFIKKDKILDGVEDVLAPNDINLFLQLTIAFESYKKYSSSTGEFISRLIINSYKAGNNNFVINTKSLAKRLDYLGESFCGLPYRIIYLQIDGNIGVYCGISSNLSSFTINGDAGANCGNNAWNSFFIVNGSVGEFCAVGGRYSSFIIRNRISQYFNSGTKNCSFVLTDANFEKDKGFCLNSESCAFKTPNQETLNQLLNYVPLKHGHKIYFINPDSTEKLVRED